MNCDATRYIVSSLPQGPHFGALDASKPLAMTFPKTEPPIDRHLSPVIGWRQGGRQVYARRRERRSHGLERGCAEPLRDSHPRGSPQVRPPNGTPVQVHSFLIWLTRSETNPLRLPTPIRCPSHQNCRPPVTNRHLSPLAPDRRQRPTDQGGVACATARAASRFCCLPFRAGQGRVLTARKPTLPPWPPGVLPLRQAERQ